MSRNDWTSRLVSAGFIALIVACGGADEPVEPPAAPEGGTATPDDEPASPAALEFVRAAAFQVTGIGDVSDLHVREQDGRRVVYVAGMCGFHVVAADTAERLDAGAYELRCPPMYRTHVVDVDGQGEPELVRLGGGLFGPCVVLESSGALRWRVEEPTRTERALDLDHDGRFELVVGKPQQPTVRMLDHAGKELWQADWGGITRHTCQADVTGDGIDEVLFVTGAAVEFWDHLGNRLHEAAPPEPAFVNWVRVLDDDERARFAVGMTLKDGAAGYRVYLLAADGMSWVGSYDTPDAQPPRTRALEFPTASHGTLTVHVREVRDRTVTGAFRGSRLQLWISDAAGNELLADTIPGVSGRAAGGGAPALLVSEEPLRFWIAYGPTVWEYRLP